MITSVNYMYKLENLEGENMTLEEIGLISYKTIGCYIFLIVILKLMGKREMSKVSTFDIVVYLIISELFSLSLNEPKHSILRTIIPISIIVILQLLTAFISLKSRKFRHITEGKQTFLIVKGKLEINEMRKQRYNIDDLMSQLHQKGIQSPIEVEYAFIEDYGTLSIIRKDNKIVKNPEVMIMDGEINQDYLKKYQITKEYVETKIKEKGYNDVSEIFFGQELIDDLYIVPFEESK